LGFVPVGQRIAVFDNDGTLWSEQPMCVGLAFALDRVKALAPQHPEWKGMTGLPHRARRSSFASCHIYSIEKLNEQAPPSCKMIDCLKKCRL
jgi:hypothetical protein